MNIVTKPMYLFHEKHPFALCLSPRPQSSLPLGTPHRSVKLTPARQSATPHHPADPPPHCPADPAAGSRVLSAPAAAGALLCLWRRRSERKAELAVLESVGLTTSDLMNNTSEASNA